MTFKEFKNEYKQLQTESERKEFIKNRLNYLLENNKGLDKIGIGCCGSYNGFITSNMSVRSNELEFFQGLKMDDMDVYEDLLNYVDNDLDRYMYGEPVTINNIQNFIWNYFGYNGGSVFQRIELYDSDEPVSIKEFKKNNLATCSERSAMVQNLLKFLGFDSEIIFGKLNDKTLHAYIIFKPENSKIRILYDPMNPVQYNVDGHKKYCPGVAKMSEEQYIDLKKGKNYIFNYDLVKKKFIQDNECVETERKYSSDDIKYIKLQEKEILNQQKAFLLNQQKDLLDKNGEVDISFQDESHLKNY